MWLQSYYFFLIYASARAIFFVFLTFPSLKFAYSKVKEVKFKSKFQTKIPEGMFVGCKNLTMVSGIKELKYIEYGAFAECSKLKSIGNPTVLYMIKRAAFWNTKKPKFKLGKKAKSDKYSFKKRKLGKDE